jgi:hypothetical protein
MSNEILPKSALTEKVTSKNYRYIVNNSYLNFRVTESFEEVVETIHTSVNSGHYHPMKPLGVYSIPKHNLVPRFIPVLTVADNILYHYLIKEIEKSLLAKKPKSVKTFGAYRVLSTAKKKEGEQREYDFIDIDEVSVGKYTVSYSWYPGWGEFNETVKNYFDKDKGKRVFVKTDIANFYDNIDLRLLENKVRSCLDSDKLSIVNLLFKLLQGVNSYAYKYNYQGKGLPQDETSDCSRLLANYFLYEFDEEFNAICEKLNSTYVRYCDDILVMCEDVKTAEKIVHTIADLLNRSGLSLNSSKTKVFKSRSAFDKYWLFAEHAKLSEMIKDLKSQKVYDEAQKLVLDSSKNERGYQLIKRWARLYSSSMKNNKALTTKTEKVLPSLSVDVVAKYLRSQSEIDRNRLLNNLYNKSRKSTYSGDLLWFRKVTTLLGQKKMTANINRHISNHPYLG